MAANDSTQSSPPNSYSGFALLVATMALILSIGAVLAVALKLDNGGTPASSGTMMSGANHGPGSMMGSGATSGGGGPLEQVKIVVKSDEEHGRLGPEGTWHDAFLPADFSVDPGATVEVVVYNYDEGEHSFTSMQLGTNATIPAGTPTHPSVSRFTFHAPTKTGRYAWFCMRPCDPWAMSHDGYMRGFVTVA